MWSQNLNRINNSSNCLIEFQLLSYRRYVDYPFILFKSRDHMEPFINYLNSQHHNINFTCEMESIKTLSFLDIAVSRSNNSFATFVHRKPTFTRFFTNFDSFLPAIYKKKGLIHTILFRYMNICSSYYLFHEELTKFKTLLLLNDYQERFLDYCFRSFLNKVFDLPIKPLTAPKLQFSIVMPFTGNHRLIIIV